MEKLLPSPVVRQDLYTLTSTVLALLVALRILDPSLVPLAMNLAAALLGLTSSTVAAVAVTTQRRDGNLP